MNTNLVQRTISLFLLAILLAACGSPPAATEALAQPTSPPETPAPTATQTPLPAPTSTPPTELDAVFYREIETTSGKRFDFLRFWPDGNVALNGAAGADVQAAYNSARDSLTPGNSNIATGTYTLKEGQVTFTLKVVNDVWAEATGALEGGKLNLTAKILLPNPATETWAYARAVFAP